MAIKKEFRSTAHSLRAAGTDKFVLQGTAASYNVLSKPLGDFRERIAPGAFTRSLKSGDDIICSFNHGVKSDVVLGRTGAGTLTLEDSARGLNFRCQLDPNQQAHRDIYSSVQRRDISECSFAFGVDEDGGDEWDQSEDEENRSFKRRTIRSAKLFDVSVVTRPAYGDGATSVSARSADYEVGRNRVVPQALNFERRLFRPRPGEKSLEQRYFEETGKEWRQFGPCTCRACTWSRSDAGISARLARYGELIHADQRAAQVEAELRDMRREMFPWENHD
jgi:HK97 family phage prohead protease